VADARKETRSRSIESGASSDAAARCEVIMLDLLYIAVVIVFFVLMWAFTKAVERL
jgi:hypothetical protein